MSLPVVPLVTRRLRKNWGAGGHYLTLPFFLQKAIRVTTFMQRLRAPDVSGRLPVTPRSSMSVAHEVTIEAPRLAKRVETPCTPQEQQSKIEEVTEAEE